MPAGALTSFSVSEAYRYFASQSQSRSRTEYLISTDDIIVLD